MSTYLLLFACFGSARFDVEADPDLGETFHFDAVQDPDPSPGQDPTRRFTRVGPGVSEI